MRVLRIARALVSRCASSASGADVGTDRGGQEDQGDNHHRPQQHTMTSRQTEEFLAVP